MLIIAWIKLNWTSVMLLWIRLKSIQLKGLLFDKQNVFFYMFYLLFGFWKGEPGHQGVSGFPGAKGDKGEKVWIDCSNESLNFILHCAF